MFARVNLEDGEEDRRGLLDLLERLDIKIDPASLSREEVRGRKGRPKSVTLTPPEETSEPPPPALEETPTTGG